MFEEIPRQRRGLARLTARKVVLGPFLIGGGVALAGLGGSVAVAGTVITAATVGLPVISHSHPSTTGELPTVDPGTGARMQTLPRPGTSVRPAPPASNAPTSVIVAPVAPSSGDRTAGSHSASASGTPSGRTAPGVPSSSAPAQTASSGPPTSGPAVSTTAGVPSASPSPAGNALVYVTGYDSSTNRVQFQYASVQPGAGPGGSNRYSVTDGPTYQAPMAAGIAITSGTTICPPAGNSCTPAQLITAAPHGFFADVALDASGALRSVIERDNAAGFGSNAPPSAAPSSSATPNALAPASPSPSATGTG